MSRFRRLYVRVCASIEPCCHCSVLLSGNYTTEVSIFVRDCLLLQLADALVDKIRVEAERKTNTINLS